MAVKKSASTRKFPRALAVRILTQVLSDRQPLDQALAAVQGEVSPASLAWLHEICAGTLRWKGRLDLAIDAAALKKKPTGWLRKVLLIGAYQLIAQTQTPAALVVSETVDEIKRKEGDAPAKFANACLRKIADHAESWRALPLQARASSSEGAQWASLPEWLWTRLVRDRGLEWAKAYALASLDRPVIWIRTSAQSAPGDWIVVGPLKGSYQVVEGGAIPEKPGFDEGHFIVQDISSQTLVDGIIEQVRGRLRGDVRALDLCAAPGGKSVGLAWGGLDVTATDLEEARFALLRQTVERTRARVQVVSRSSVNALESFGLVWVDAPCTGTGILRRHPDVRWLRQEKEIAGLLKIQQELIKEAWSKVMPGGFLAYSVCSVLKEEGPGALEKASLPGEKIAEWTLDPQEPPHGDGFYGALIRKTS